MLWFFSSSEECYALPTATHPSCTAAVAPAFTFRFLAQGKKRCLLSLALASFCSEVVLTARAIHILNSVTELQKPCSKCWLTSNCVTCTSWSFFSSSASDLHLFCPSTRQRAAFCWSAWAQRSEAGRMNKSYMCLCTVQSSWRTRNFPARHGRLAVFLLGWLGLYTTFFIKTEMGFWTSVAGTNCYQRRPNWGEPRSPDVSQHGDTPA